MWVDFHILLHFSHILQWTLLLLHVTDQRSALWNGGKRGVKGRRCSVRRFLLTLVGLTHFHLLDTDLIKGLKRRNGSWILIQIHHTPAGQVTFYATQPESHPKDRAISSLFYFICCLSWWWKQNVPQVATCRIPLTSRSPIAALFALWCHRWLSPQGASDLCIIKHTAGNAHTHTSRSGSRCHQTLPVINGKRAELNCHGSTCLSLMRGGSAGPHGEPGQLIRWSRSLFLTINRM